MDYSKYADVAANQTDNNPGTHFAPSFVWSVYY